MKSQEIFAKYGLQNVASNFAYDRRQEFFKKPLAIHGAAFMVGGVGASLQQGIMGGEGLWGDGTTFAKKFGLSMLSYGAEYSSNYYFKTKMQYVNFGDYRSNKGASFGLKGLAYSWLYTWY
jgi:F0F1-type ATP synthase membrane subunit c/vacuolar-type H+-ATPase subunit K